MSAALRVLVVHNAYQQAGGEDGVVAAEIALLRDHGDTVVELRRDNHEISGITGLGRGLGNIRLAAQTLWSSATHAQALALIEQHRPDVVHVHNTFPLISPSLYWACAQAGVPVVQTLHNFRLACPQAMFLRDGTVCESCLGKPIPWPALVHGCYRGSRVQTAAVVGMLALHRGLKTFETQVTRYIALNAFCRDKFIAAGLPAQRIAIKPNFAEVPASAPAATPAAAATAPRAGLLFVGRLAAEKGIDVLARAWPELAGLRPGSAFGLRVAGSGAAGAALEGLAGVTLLGRQSAAQIQHEMQSAIALVMPSTWYENFPLTLVEAFGAGLPVIASRIGALAELVEDGVTGLLFEPGNAVDLARVMRWAADHPQQMAAMGARARLRFDARYTPAINYRQLRAIYADAIDAQRGESAA